jgi:hypothetical protein
MYVYLQAYPGLPPAAAPGSQPPAPLPLVAFVSLYQNGKKAFESSAIAATPEAGSRLGITPLSFQLRLGDLSPGEYQCQISVLDPSGHRVAFWVNSILLVH